MVAASSKILALWVYFLTVAYPPASFGGTTVGEVQHPSTEQVQPESQNWEESIEARWFFTGDMPSNVSDWFNNNNRLGGRPPSKDERTDLYLIARGGPHLGIKLREGKLELKERTEAKELQQSGGLILANGERWRKWEWIYADVQKASGRELDSQVAAGFQSPNGLWVDVYKDRDRRPFLFAEDGGLQPTTGRIPKGVLAEVTKLKAAGQSYWTLAVEIVGDVDQPFERLNGAIHWLLEDYPGPTVSSSNSYSYPEWIVSSIPPAESGSYSHVVEGPYYLASPAQGSPPDGSFSSGTKVIVLDEGGSYSLVRSEDGIRAFVATGSLRRR